MFEYSRSAVNSSFDFVKKIIFVFQIIIQIVYISYISYRVFSNTGNEIINYVLLIAATIYLVIYLITNSEFYTNKIIIVRKVSRRIFKTIKYIISIYTITLAIIVLSQNDTTDNITMLLTLLMIVGLIASILFDVLLILIDNQIQLVNNAFLYDIENIRENKRFTTTALKTVLKIDLEELFPKVQSNRMINRVKKVNDIQKDKKDRKEEFKRKNK